LIQRFGLISKAMPFIWKIIQISLGAAAVRYVWERFPGGTFVDPDADASGVSDYGIPGNPSTFDTIDKIIGSMSGKSLLVILASFYIVAIYKSGDMKKNFL
jgi:hypothetical protein